MKAIEIFSQNDGEVTKAYYSDLSSTALGEIAVCLFRAQKRSSRAKEYRGGRYRRSAYDVKSWSMEQLCDKLAAWNLQALLPSDGIPWGWKQDSSVQFGAGHSWVLYVDLPQGQVSFHSPTRMKGTDYLGEWCGQHKSAERILAFCDHVAAGQKQRSAA